MVLLSDHLKTLALVESRNLPGTERRMRVVHICVMAFMWLVALAFVGIGCYYYHVMAVAQRAIEEEIPETLFPLRLHRASVDFVIAAMSVGIAGIMHSFRFVFAIVRGFPRERKVDELILLMAQRLRELGELR